MPPFHPNAMVPVPAPTAPSSTVPSFAPAIAAGDVLARHVQPANVVERAVVGLADERIHGSHALVAGLHERPADDRVDRGAYRERVRQNDGRFDRAEFLDLSRPGELAEGVPDKDGAGHLLLEQIAAMREDGGHAGANVVAFDNGGLPDAHAGDVGNRIQRTGREISGRDRQVTRARPGRGLRESQTEGHQGDNHHAHRPMIQNRDTHLVRQDCEGPLQEPPCVCGTSEEPPFNWSW